ncbi:3'(2'),5'-bisphosphate nucleotidase CysQ [Nymphon striatum]|nr:3'(2'),5'-bisphosphate nucleotidase CysQ [Nymphon striatum]
MNKDQLLTLLPEVRRIAEGAGHKIMEIYESGFETETKSDDSPVTTADLAANTFIDEELKKLDIQFPILSEESAHLSFEERSSRETYWLVDPLDALGLSYFACEGHGSFKTTDAGNAEIEQIHSRDIPVNAAIFVGSRSHTGEDMAQFLENYKADKGEYDLQSMGSSLKMCMVAEGKADLYPRLWLTSEWDTAACSLYCK